MTLLENKKLTADQTVRVTEYEILQISRYWK